MREESYQGLPPPLEPIDITRYFSVATHLVLPGPAHRARVRLRLAGPPGADEPLVVAAVAADAVVAIGHIWHLGRCRPRSTTEEPTLTTIPSRLNRSLPVELFVPQRPYHTARAPSKREYLERVNLERENLERRRRHSDVPHGSIVLLSAPTGKMRALAGHWAAGHWAAWHRAADPRLSPERLAPEDQINPTDSIRARVPWVRGG